MVHVKRHPYHFYIGRRNARAGLQGSRLGNPWTDSHPYPHGDNIAGFRETFYSRPDLQAYAREQYAKHQALHPGEPFKIACWCAPARCHGDVIKEYLESLDPPHTASPEAHPA